MKLDDIILKAKENGICEQEIKSVYSHAIASYFDKFVIPVKSLEKTSFLIIAKEYAFEVSINYINSIRSKEQLELGI